MCARDKNNLTADAYYSPDAFEATDDSWSRILPRPSSIVSSVSRLNSTLTCRTLGTWSTCEGRSCTYEEPRPQNRRKDIRLLEFTHAYAQDGIVSRSQMIYPI